MNYAILREKMVQQQIEKRGVQNRDVLKAMGVVPRHIFVKNDYLSEAYCDYPLPIGFNQSISQPYIVALMIELLRVKPRHKVLEVGTGCGYQTAVLAEIAAQVYSVEIIPELSVQAAKNLQHLNYSNIHLKLGDGLLSWKNEAPFDRIIVAAAPHHLPQELVKQLKVGGYMVIPIGFCPQNLCLIYRQSENNFEQKFISHVAFVPMTGKVLNQC